VRWDCHGGQTKIVHGGAGGMPSYAGRLSAKQIRDVAVLVATSAGRR
jgi:mono/diheme cytochrome c family protein